MVRWGSGFGGSKVVDGAGNVSDAMVGLGGSCDGLYAMVKFGG